MDQKRIGEIKARCEAANQPYPKIRTEMDAYPWVHAQVVLKQHARQDIPFLLSEIARVQAALDAAELVLRKLCQGRMCTGDQECPLGTYFDCSVPELIMQLEGWGPEPVGLPREAMEDLEHMLGGKPDGMIVCKGPEPGGEVQK